MTRGIPTPSTNPAAPSKELTAWKSPAVGHPGRDPKRQLWMYFETVTPLSAESFDFAGLTTGIRELLGEHPVRVSAIGARDPRPLAKTGIEWKSRPSSRRFDTMISWLERPASWVRLDPAVVGCMGEVAGTRGTGAGRQEIWRLTWEPRVRHHPANLQLSIATRHISTPQLKALDQLLKFFYAAAAKQGAYYGHAELWRQPNDWPTPHDYMSDEFVTMANMAERARDVSVPWAKRWMFLGPARTAHLGGIKAMREPYVKLKRRKPVFTELPKVCSLVELRSLDAWSVDLVDEDGESGSCSFGSRCILDPCTSWMLHQFAQAGMLDVQNLNWVPKSISEEAESQNAKPIDSTVRRKREREQMKASRQLLLDLRSRPPKCIQIPARTSFGDDVFKREGRNHDWVTAFDIRGKGLVEGLTLYGRPSADKLQLGSPIRAGSLDPDRAALNFDAYLHGWDGAQVDPGARTDTPKLKQFKCPKCQGRHFRLRAFFEYAEDTATSLDENDLHRAEDFFTWFSLDARCVACSWKGTVADIETA